MQPVLQQYRADRIRMKCRLPVDFEHHVIFIERHIALMARTAQTVDQIAAKVRAHGMTGRRRTVQREVRYGRLRGLETEYLQIEELGDELFLVLAKRLQFRRVVARQRVAHDRVDRCHLVMAQTCAPLPQVGQCAFPSMLYCRCALDMCHFSPRSGEPRCRGKALMLTLPVFAASVVRADPVANESGTRLAAPY
jgi:hypothetical protein